MHEIAHRIDYFAYNQLSFDIRGEFYRIWRSDKNPGSGPTKRAHTGRIEEDVAESIARYVWDRQAPTLRTQT